MEPARNGVSVVVKGRHRLHEPHEGFYRYDYETGLWLETTTALIKTEVSSSILSAHTALDEFRTNSTLDAVMGHLRGIVEHRNAFQQRKQAAHLKNCMLQVTESEQTPKDFSPDFYSRNQSPIVYDPTATCPRFLTELIGPAVHPEDQILLQKYAGQCLLGENVAQRLLLVDGNAGTGKTQFALILQSIVGQVNCGQLRTKHLTDRFEVGRMLKKTLLVGVDVDAKFLSCEGAPVIKSLVGGDTRRTCAVRSGVPLTRNREDGRHVPARIRRGIPGVCLGIPSRKIACV